MNSSYQFFKKNYFHLLLDGQKRILDDLELKNDKKSFFTEFEKNNPNYFPFLIRMPTGTGKTGVIAVTAYFANENGSTLILTPWKNLCDQLQEDLDKNFWDKIELSKNEKSKYIFNTDRMFPSKLDNYFIVKNNSKFILVGTLNGLQTLLRKYPNIYEELIKNIKLVIVDEGHYEPAVLWGRAVKKLNKPTLILTATPYRNDLKLFHISKNHVSHYEHYKAIETKIKPLREIENIKLNTNSFNFSELLIEFIDYWKNLDKNKLPDENPRIIICCESKKRIMEGIKILYYLKTKISYKAFHERVDEDDFKNEPELKKKFQKIVPNAKESSETIWIHQNKLTEGLDDPRFCILLITYPFTNDRKLVQQVGRVLRHSNNTPKEFKGRQKAFVVYCSDYNFEEVWDSYLNYEKILDLTTGEHYRNVINSYLALQPEYEYFDKKFRKRLIPFISNKSEMDIEQWKKEAWNNILTPPSVLILRIKEDFDMDDFIEATSTGLLLRDSVILGTKDEKPIVKDDKIILWIYAKIKNSDILLTRSAYEISIEARFIYKIENYLFLGDSSGISIEDYLSTYAFSITYFDLINCLDKTYTIRQASLFNTQSLNTAVRRTIRQGVSLDDSPYQISEKKYICQNLRARKKGQIGDRYFGLTTGRISDRISQDKKRKFNLSQFIKWSDDLFNILVKKNNVHNFLSRYANIIPKPDDAIPYMLILDPNPDLIQNFDLKDNNIEYDNELINWYLINDKKEVSLDETVFDFSQKSGDKEYPFLLKIVYNEEGNTNPLITNIYSKYDHKKGQFNFKKGNEVNLRVKYNNDIFNVEHFLNTRHDRYAITLQKPILVYHNRQFFDLDYSNAEEKFSTYIKKINQLSNIKYEKISNSMNKNKQNIKNWPKESLFYVTLNHIITPSEFDWIYCDDPNREIADFIVVSFTYKKVAFIHCKYGKGMNISGSAFHELTSQAGKNLVYLRTNRYPPNIKYWNRSSKWNNTNINKWIKGSSELPENEKIWDKINKEILKHPSGKVEIWLVMGNGLDVDKLNKTITGHKKSYEVGPLLHLLDGLVANCYEAAATLKIYGH